MKLNNKKSSKTTCCYCGVGCGININVDKHNHIQLEGDEDYPVNKGMLCSKGKNLHYTVQDKSDRLISPQIRWSKHHPLENTNWEMALDRASAVFSTLIKNYGPDAVGFYVSGQCLTEEYYLVNKLTKGFIGTNNIDTNSRLCMSSAVAAYIKMLGEDSVPIAYDDIELADCFLITGANPAWCHPILYRRLEKHRENKPDVKVIVIDPRVTDTAVQSDLHLQIRPGTDTIVYHAIGRWLIENGEIDVDFVQNHTDGYEKYKSIVFERTIKQAAIICDIPEEQIILAAKLIANANGFIAMWAMGINQSTSGVSKNIALISLNLITGHIAKPGSGPFSLTGQPNAMGGREVGGMASLLAAHRSLASKTDRQEVADFWNVEKISDKPGLTATQMFEALASGEMKAIWIICTNPAVSMPNAKLVDEALKKAKFVVVQDISSKSDTLAYADLVLPAAGWLEKEGTMTNSERRISYLPKVIDPPGEALPDTEIICRFAQKMGYPGFDYSNTEEIYDEHCQLTKGTNIDISGLSYQKLIEARSMQWPVPSTAHVGTARLFEDKKFFTKSGNANLDPIAGEMALEPIDEEYPLILTTGRIRDQWHTMTKTGKVSKLQQHIPGPKLEIHPEDAMVREIEEGDIVTINNQRGEVRLPTKLSNKIKKGVVFLPMHWGKTLKNDRTRANNLTNDQIDPISKQPGFKFASVQVKKFEKPKQKIIVVGAGAAAYRFIMSYRQRNQTDEIHIFSKEKELFYNRVLLPEYVNDHLSWEALLKFKFGEIGAMNMNVYVENSIVAINKKEKFVTDAKGHNHNYDVLIMGMGSRAFVPGDVPIHLPGVSTMRNKKDADNLKNRLNHDGEVVIVGGGLLGLELAASLREIDIKVTIVQLSSRLMERQLDSIASSLLREKIEELSVKVYTNDQVQHLESIDDTRLKIRLKSGLSLEADAVVYAIGTRPNIEIAKEAGLDCGKGVKVNGFLQTSDPSIFAMGEIAEFQQKLNGITSAAEQHADCIAKYLSGDLTSPYQGSLSMNILKIDEFDLCSLGIPDPPTSDPSYEEILFIDKRKLYYKKCLIKDDRLVGAILMGDKSEFVEFKKLIAEKIELSEKRLALLRSGKPPEPIIGELVCSCNNVGDGNIKKYIAEGCVSLDSICEASGAGTGCGSCKPEIQYILNQEKALPVPS